MSAGFGWRKTLQLVAILLVLLIGGGWVLRQLPPDAAAWIGGALVVGGVGARLVSAWRGPVPSQLPDPPPDRQGP